MQRKALTIPASTPCDSSFLSAFLSAFLLTQAQGSSARDSSGMRSTMSSTQLLATEHAWRAANDQWCVQFSHLLIEPFASQLHFALQHKQLFTDLLVHGKTPQSDSDPALGEFVATSPLAAKHQQNTSRSTSDTREYLLAGQALMQMYSQLTQDALRHTQSELAQGNEPAAENSRYTQYSESFAKNYRKHINTKRFTQLAAQFIAAYARKGLVNTAPSQPSSIPHNYDLVHQSKGAKLWRYRAKTAQLARPSSSPPLLIVTSLIHRHNIIDIDPECSLVAALCDKGRDVYFLQWPEVKDTDPSCGLETYLLAYLHECVSALQSFGLTQQIDLLGIAQGGNLALCYAALKPHRIRRLALLATPVDFEAEDFLLAHWMRELDLDLLRDQFAMIPGHIISWSLMALQAPLLPGMRILDQLAQWQASTSDRSNAFMVFAKAQKWLLDNPDQASDTCVQFIRTFIHDNALMTGTVHIAEHTLSLASITQPVLNIYAREDYLAPASACRPLSKVLINANCTSLEVAGDHIGLFTRHRSDAQIPTIIDRWLDDAS